MLRVNECKLPVTHTQQQLKNELARILHTDPGSLCFRTDPLQSPAFPEQQGREGADLICCEIVRRSLDARKKPDLFYVYTIDVTAKKEQKLLKRCAGRKVSICTRTDYHFPYEGFRQDTVPDGAEEEAVFLPPVVTGSGPAGLFCALMLARAGLRPVILERGEPVEQRRKTVERFWETGILDPESNVQFGEGGAGTFSDGKLNTLIKDPSGRVRFVLREFVRAGAPADILIDHKPHLGTDVLGDIVSTIRKEIESLGGSFRFSTRLTGYTVRKDGSILVHTTGGDLETNALVLAIGHSSRDTLRMLHEKGLEMHPKAFAVGLRVQHPQNWIDRAMYGAEDAYGLGAAPYKLTHQCANGRGVYTFCMCPGGYVVNASSEPGRLAVNGMSYSGRASGNANSAVVVTVTPHDYGDTGDPLSGVRFQESLEEKAFLLGKGAIPVQRFRGFSENAGNPGRTEPAVVTDDLKNAGCTDTPEGSDAAEAAIRPVMKGAYTEADLSCLFPQEITDSLVEGMHAFGRKIPGYDHPDTVLAGVESRTSSPVRLSRDEECQCSQPGIFPCGEGAGYAGGITSAAVDGIRVAEAVCRCIIKIHGKHCVRAPMKI